MVGVVLSKVEVAVFFIKHFVLDVEGFFMYLFMANPLCE